MRAETKRKLIERIKDHPERTDRDIIHSLHVARKERVSPTEVQKIREEIGLPRLIDKDKKREQQELDEKKVEASRMRYEEHKTLKEIAAKYGISKSLACRWTIRPKGSVATRGFVKTSTSKEKAHIGGGLSEEQLRSKIDTAFMVEQFAAKIPKGTFYTEPDIIGRLHLRGAYRATLGSSRFMKYRGVADGGVIYWGHPERIEALKEEQLLR